MGRVKFWVILLVHYFGRFVAWITEPVFRWKYDGASRGVPPVDSPLLMMTAVELASQIRKRKVTSVEVTKKVIERIKQVNPFINAVVADRFDDALKDAAKVDEVLDSGNIPESMSETNAPFLGVPVTTKEAISIAGLPNTSGMLRRRGVLSPKDAEAIALMRKAGAIPLAVTNVSELCMWYESSNLVYGCTRNAYHQGRMVGGSSGGEGCLQSAAASPMGIGSDIGGSIRMPAFFNGVFGHKATTGVVNNDGQFPMAVGDAASFLSTGPLCRYATDLLPIFRLLVLPAYREKLRLNEQVDVRKLKYFYMEDDGGGLCITPAYPIIKETVRKAAKHFESLGCSVQRVSLLKLRKSFAMWSSLMANSEGKTFSERLADNSNRKEINPHVELLLWMIGAYRHTLPAIGLALGEKVRNGPAKDAALRRLRDSLLSEMETLLGDNGVFIYPGHPRPAPYHHQSLITLFNFAYTGIFNILGLPATAVPMGIAPDEGVPVGVQVIGSRFNDRLSLAVAVELEKAFGGWVPPFEVPKN